MTAQSHMQESANRNRFPVPFTFGNKVQLKAANVRFVQQHVLNYATLAHFSLRRKFPRLRFGLSYPMEYGFMMLYTPVY
jgi:hypothetical protein